MHCHLILLLAQKVGLIILIFFLRDLWIFNDRALLVLRLVDLFHKVSKLLQACLESIFIDKGVIVNHGTMVISRLLFLLIIWLPTTVLTHLGFNSLSNRTISCLDGFLSFLNWMLLNNRGSCWCLLVEANLTVELSLFNEDWPFVAHIFVRL